MALDDSIETKDGLNLDNPLMLLFRKLMLERNAKKENSDLYCPKCKTNLPYNDMTVARVPDGIDADFRPVFKMRNYCPFCEEYW